MRKIALVHKKWFEPTAVTDRWKCLFEGIRDECGFEIAFIEETNAIPADADVVLFSCAAKHLDDKRIFDLGLGFKGRLIAYLADYDPARTTKATTFLTRADLILAPEAGTYVGALPGKHIAFFPYFFAPHERYMRLSWNDNPKMRCLVSGPVDANYPLRQAAAKSPLADILPHKGSHGSLNTGAVVRDAYARKLNEYACAVAGSLRSGITTKTFEIQAAGALLITDPVPDMELLGMRAWEHYIPATEADVEQKINVALCSPTKSDTIRRAGMQQVLERHSIRNRIGQFRFLWEA